MACLLPCASAAVLFSDQDIGWRFMDNREPSFLITPHGTMSAALACGMEPGKLIDSSASIGDKWKILKQMAELLQ
jgi:hypothetical protein